MTEIATEALPVPADDTWTQQLDALKARYKHVREPVLVALNILLHDANVDLDDAKARAQVHGIRITAASMNAARTLLARMSSSAEPAAANGKPAPAPARRVRRSRPSENAPDAETLIRGFVAKLQGQGDAEAERLREAMRKAIAVLQTAVGDS